MPTSLLALLNASQITIEENSESYKLLSRFQSSTENTLSGDAQLDEPGKPIDFVVLQDRVSISAAEHINKGNAAPHAMWRLPAAFQYDFTPPTPQDFFKLELTLASVSVALPFLHGASMDGNNPLIPVEQAVSVTLPRVTLLITPDSPDDQAPSISLSVPDQLIEHVSMIPAHAFIGEGELLGFGFQEAVFRLSDTGQPMVDIADAQVFLAIPHLPFLGIQAPNEHLQLGLGSEPGVTAEWRIDPAAIGGANTLPKFLRDLTWYVRVNQNSIVSYEVAGKVHFPSALPMDGAIDDGHGLADFTLIAAYDFSVKDVQLTLTFKANPGYLWRVQKGDSIPDILRNTLGAFAVLGPLLDGQSGTREPGQVASIALAANMVTGFAGTILTTEAVTLHSMELLKPAGTAEYSLLFDCETHLSLKADTGGISLQNTRPMKVRHKALGVRLDFAGTQPTLHPVFDSSRGYTFDVSDPGLLQIPGPLGDILHVLGARMARTNPLNFEVDLGIKADLGVVSVERTSVRIPISPFGVPTITALGAHITIPGAIDGHGYLSIDKAGFTGKLDLSLVPLAVRVAGGLAVESVPGATAALVTMEVDFPVPVPLYSSGLGLYGVLGLFGMHFMRDQQGNETALNWFERIGGNPIQIHPGWRSAVDQWAFGIGAVLGTMEGGFILNLKGVVVIELPGPRLLLLMKADLLSQKPKTQGVDGGTILAVVEVSSDAISIGLVVEFKKASPLLEIRIPANARFPIKSPENFELDLGTFIDPATVKFLIGFRASGYLMIHGNGIPTQGVTVPDLASVFPIGPLLGYAIAAGVRASFTWGVEEIGLYARVAAQVDIDVSFNPFLIVGKMVLSGELHLFIASIEITASADVAIRSASEYYIRAVLSGRIRFWPLPAIKGSVTIELGDSPIELPPAPPLVRALSLYSRPPTVLLGNNTDRAIDGSLCDATQDDSIPRKIDGDGQAHEVLVPIDSIPVLQFEMPPCIDENCKPLGQSLSSPVNPFVNGWVRRGERFYRYTVTAIDWSNGIGEGDKPLTWWSRKTQADDTDMQLSFLNWTPHAAPTAVPRSINQQDAVRERWGSICSSVAEPTSVLWTFNATPLGSSETGWTLQGMVGPDKAGTYRSTPPPSRLRVTEQWRTGYSLIDSLLEVNPALIIGPNLQALGRILRSPFSEGELHTNVREDVVAEIVQLALREGQQQGRPLCNAVLLHTDRLNRIRLLLQVPSRLLPLDLLVLRPCAADGTPLGDDMLVDGRVINPATDLPPTWSSGPWSADVQEAIAQHDTALQQALHMETNYVLFEQDLPEGTEQLELGIRAPEHLDEFLLQFLRYWVIGIEGWPLAEWMRYDYDTKTRSHNIKTVDGALGADSAKLSLLQPNTLYTVSVNYKVEIGEEYQADEKPDKGSQQGKNSRGQMVPIKKIAEDTPTPSSFTFKTDDEPPARLDPWIVCTNPTPSDLFHFWGDPVVVTFQTGAVRKMFAAYARSLRGIVRAASGRHSVNEPTHPNTFAALNEQVAQSIDIPLATTATPTMPWKQAMVEVMADSCVDIQAATEHHELIVLPLLLDAQTDYIFDIVTEQAPSVPLFRRSFTTSRYRTVQEMAAHIADMQVAHRWIANAAPLHDLLTAIAPRVAEGQGIQLSDQEIEQTLLHSGWGGIAVPREPSIVVIWQDGEAAQPPQPVALLIDSPEPLWRWRQVPHEIMDAERPDHVKWWRLQDTLWLELIETQTAGAVVSRFAYNQSGGRTLVLLKPNARGGRLNLSLKKTPHRLLDTQLNGLTLPLIVANLEAAPWEEQ